MEKNKRSKPIGIGARPKGPKGPNPLRRGQGENQPQRQQPPQQAQDLFRVLFPGIYEIFNDWTLIEDLLGPIIEQKEAICWAIMLARLIEAAHNIYVGDSSLFLQISIDDLVSKIKQKDKDKEITTFKRCLKMIELKGVKKVPTTSNASSSMLKLITWKIDSNEAADMNFIADKLRFSPVGIVIDIDAEFHQVREGFYRIRVVPLDPHGHKERHALMILARGRTQDGLDFFFAQNSWEKNKWGVKGYGRIVIDARTYDLFGILSTSGIDLLQKQGGFKKVRTLDRK